MQRNAEIVIGGQYTMQRIVLMLGAKQSATWASLTALQDPVHSDGAISLEWNVFLLLNFRESLICAGCICVHLPCSL